MLVSSWGQIRQHPARLLLKPQDADHAVTSRRRLRATRTRRSSSVGLAAIRD
jgi:hypothetical protein